MLFNNDIPSCFVTFKVLPIFSINIKKSKFSLTLISKTIAQRVSVTHPRPWYILEVGEIMG